MNKNKKTAILVGALILIAFGVIANAITEFKIIVMVADVVSGLAVIGIAILMFPFFKVISNKLSLSYLSVEIVEGVIMITGGFFFLNNSLHSLRDLVYNGIHLYLFILSGFIFYYLLYKSKIIPRFLSIWGTVAIFSLLVMTILKLSGLNYPMLDLLLVPIISNEIFLAIWLMVKGFNLSTINSVKTKNNMK